MEHIKIKSLLLVGVITLAASMFAGCTEYADDPAEFTTENIVINYTDSVIDASISSGSRTRSVPESTEISSGVLTSKSGKKMYLSCTEAPWPVEKNVVTRGAKVTTVGISNMGVSASVYGSSSSYTSAGCGSYFYKESVSSGTPTRFYWPTADYKISFFGYYPYNNAAFTVQSAASATGAPTYSYTVPSAIASQQDIMTGQVVDRLGGSASAVNITLSHRCAAIRFSITNDRSEAITMNTISIEGVKYTGTFNENTWTLGDAVNSSSSNPFTLTCNTTVAAGATVDITGTDNIFLMLPQTLPAGAKLKMTTDDDEFEADLTGTWLAGKGYNYNTCVGNGVIDLSSAVVTATNQTYSGTEKTPAPTVTLNGSIVPNTGYDVVYSNNINAGTATITITGKDDYEGTATGTFTIAKASRTLSFGSDYMVLSPSSNGSKTATPSAGSEDGEITYSLANTTYATINSSTGAVTSKTSDGSVTVTATLAEGTNYLSTTASYTLYVFATTHNYSYTGNYQSVTLPPGTYQFQVWGAQGGSNASASSYSITAKSGGKGGYSVGQLTISQATGVRVYVGGQGSSSSGGYNGDSRMIVAGGGAGGAMCYQYKTTTTTNWKNLGTRNYSYSGAGSSDGNQNIYSWNGNYQEPALLEDGKTYKFSVSPTTNISYIAVVQYRSDGSFITGTDLTVSNNSSFTFNKHADSHHSMISIYSSTLGVSSYTLTLYEGETSTSTSTSTDYQVGGYGGGTSGGGYSTSYVGKQNAAGSGGSFGQGANQTTTNYRYCSGAGGGGWYGGGGGKSSDSSMSYCKYSGGGSGFVNTAANASYRPSGYAGLQLTSGTVYAGNSSFPNTAGTGNETGHSGNGYAKITRIN